MTNLIIHEYYYRYQEQRKQIKNILDSGNFEEARTKLNTVLAEHQSKYPWQSVNTRKDFNFGESIILRHAKKHLDFAIDVQNNTFQDENGNIFYLTDKVKRQIIDAVKPDYNSPPTSSS